MCLQNINAKAKNIQLTKNWQREALLEDKKTF